VKKGNRLINNLWEGDERRGTGDEGQGTSFQTGPLEIILDL